jgi:four helix bundle protein
MEKQLRDNRETMGKQWEISRKTMEIITILQLSFKILQSSFNRITNNYMKLLDLEVYIISLEIAEDIWNIVIKWDKFAKNTLGYQIVRALDSIGANISEGYGRFHYKDRKRFYYFSRGSLYETITWVSKSYKRNLIPKEDYLKLQKQLKNLSIKLNNFIKQTKENNRKTVEIQCKSSGNTIEIQLKNNRLSTAFQSFYNRLSTVFQSYY